MGKKVIILILLLVTISACSKTNLQEVNNNLEKELEEVKNEAPTQDYEAPVQNYEEKCTIEFFHCEEFTINPDGTATLIIKNEIGKTLTDFTLSLESVAGTCSPLYWAGTYWYEDTWLKCDFIGLETGLGKTYNLDIKLTYSERGKSDRISEFGKLSKQIKSDEVKNGQLNGKIENSPISNIETNKKPEVSFEIKVVNNGLSALTLFANRKLLHYGSYLISEPLIKLNIVSDEKNNIKNAVLNLQFNDFSNVETIEVGDITKKINDCEENCKQPQYRNGYLICLKDFHCDTVEIDWNPTMKENILEVRSEIVVPITAILSYEDSEGNVYSDKKVVNYQLLPVDKAKRFGGSGKDMELYYGMFITPYAVEDFAKNKVSFSINNKEDVNNAVRNIYNSLKESGVSYSTERKEADLQSPAMTLRLKQGKCDESSLLISSLLESLGIKTKLIAYTRPNALIGHMFIVYYDTENWIPLETTTISTNSFEESLEVGKINLKESENDKWSYVIDLREILAKGITPPYSKKE
ncbi:MAG TPA: transglutaminase domain-containing protein [Candidatus Nanoarchaeia archaeon]|nr:transglutaminase domain-containing protein [Candidatus Nanoarchaeia archaeon]